jgi:pimeloyl-ACP methyl ester carboxylesterase
MDKLRFMLVFSISETGSQRWLRSDPDCEILDKCRVTGARGHVRDAASIPTRAKIDMASRAGSFPHQAIEFWYAEKGSQVGARQAHGMAFVFQHGLGGDRRQPLELYAYHPSIHLLAMDCRGHGKTRPLGDPDMLRFDVFADDIVALLDHLAVDQFVAGGISMGAGVALNLALRYAARVAGLILVRPAWLAQPSPPNLDCMVEVGQWIRDHGVVEGRRGFLASPLYLRLAQAAPYTASSLLAQFDEPRAADAWPRLLHLPADAPNRDPAAWRQIVAPTLVLGNQMDPTHPFFYAKTLAAALPRAELVEVPSKSDDAKAHVAAARTHIDRFLRHMAAGA